MLLLFQIDANLQLKNIDGTDNLKISIENVKIKLQKLKKVGNV